MYEIKAWIRYLRNAATEFRACREKDDEESLTREGLLNLELSQVIVEASKRGYLKGIEEIAAFIQSAESDKSFIDLRVFLFIKTMGYQKVEYTEDDVWASNDPTEFHETAVPYLGPGYIGVVSPLVFRNIEGNLLVDEEIVQFKKSGGVDKFKQDKRFARLGYYSLGCELLADLIEAEQPIVDDVEQAQKSEFVAWGGDATEQTRVSIINPLTENDRLLLTAMLEVKATIVKPETAITIVRAAFYAGDEKRAFKNLMSNGFVDSKKGKSGGYWLTEIGEKVAKTLASK